MVTLTLLTVGLAAIWDIRTRRIPNLITLSAVVFGIIFNICYAGIVGLGNSLAGTVAGVLLLLIPFVIGAIGAGDVKLLAAVGALNGLKFTLEAFLYSALAGGVIALVVALKRGKLNFAVFNTFLAFKNLSLNKLVNGKKEAILPFHSNLRFPYGIAILTGTVAAFYLR